MSPSASRNRSFFTALVAAALAMAIVLWCAYWAFALAASKDRLDVLHRDLKASRITIECSNERWSGFPFRIALQCTPLLVTMKAVPSPLTLSIPRIDVLAQAYDPYNFIVLAASPIELTGLSDRAVTLRHSRAALRFEEHAERKLSLFFDALETSPPTFEAERLDIVLALEPQTRSLRIDELVLNRQQMAVHATGRVSLDASRKLDGRLKLSIDRLDMALADLSRAGLVSKSDDAAALLDGLRVKDRRVNLELRLDRGRIYLGPFKLGDLPPLGW
jgi:hypothetical protein